MTETKTKSSYQSFFCKNHACKDWVSIKGDKRFWEKMFFLGLFGALGSDLEKGSGFVKPKAKATTTTPHPTHLPKPNQTRNVHVLQNSRKRY